MLRVNVRGTTGSGQRLNRYADASFEPAGGGNRLQLPGSLQAFLASNDGIAPAPRAEFFEAGR